MGVDLRFDIRVSCPWLFLGEASDNDYGLLKPAPHSAPADIISVIETPRVFRAPLRPLRSPARRNLTVLTSLTPPVGDSHFIMSNSRV